MIWVRKLGIALMAVATMFGVTACPPNPNIDDAARAWIREVDEIIPAGKPAERIADIYAGRGGAQKSEWSSKLESAPDLSPKLSPEVRDKLSHTIEQAENILDFYTYLDGIPARTSTADDAVSAMITESPRNSFTPEAEQVLVESSKEILHDAACGLAWDLMKPEEQAAANDSGYVASSDLIPQLANLSIEALIDAIAGFLQNRYLKLFSDADQVDWAFYGHNVYGNATELTGDGANLLALPEATVTRAMVYYARLCLKPPA